MTHKCHAVNCDIEIKPKLFMCRKHWFSLPLETRIAIWDNYQRGQEVTKTPSKSYLEITKAAIEWLAKKEGKIS